MSPVWMIEGGATAADGFELGDGAVGPRFRDERADGASREERRLIALGLLLQFEHDLAHLCRDLMKHRRLLRGFQRARCAG